MVAAIIKSSWLDNPTGVDDNTFAIDLPVNWIGTLHSQSAFAIDGDILVGLQFLYTDLANPAAFATKLKAALSARATALGYTVFGTIELPTFTRIAVP